MRRRGKVNIFINLVYKSFDKSFSRPPWPIYSICFVLSVFVPLDELQASITRGHRCTIHVHVQHYIHNGMNDRVAREEVRAFLYLLHKDRAYSITSCIRVQGLMIPDLVVVNSRLLLYCQDFYSLLMLLRLYMSSTIDTNPSGLNLAFWWKLRNVKSQWFSKTFHQNEFIIFNNRIKINLKQLSS